MSAKNKILIRVDGSNKIGLGHIVRTFALAQILNESYTIQFYCKEIPEKLESEIVEKGFGVQKIFNEEQFFSQIQPNHIVVIDGYEFDSEYMKLLKGKGAKVVVIDDLCNMHYYADLIINHSPSANKDKYEALPNTKFALGLDYALLREKFLLQATKHRTIKKVSNVIVCFGGADPQNYTYATLKVLSQFKGFNKIVAIVGSGYTFGESLLELADSDTRIQVKQCLNEQEMIKEMLQAELAITSASGIALEAICCGCIPLIGITAMNQENFHDAIVKRVSVRSFGNNMETFQSESLFEALKGVNPDFSTKMEVLRLKMARAPQNLVSIFTILNNG